MLNYATLFIRDGLSGILNKPFLYFFNFYVSGCPDIFQVILSNGDKFFPLYIVKTATAKTMISVLTMAGIIPSLQITDTRL